MLKTLAPEQITRVLRDPVDAEARTIAQTILSDVQERGESALRHHAERLQDIQQGKPLFLSRQQLQSHLDALPRTDRELLERTAERIRTFAQAQRASLHPTTIEVPGGRAGQWIAPVERAGCYAPGGRFPLPSSVLMTAVTARTAGVETVWVASPRPAPITCAAAAVAGADGLLQAGGAQAIAAFAVGVGPLPPCDAIVGPGNRFVTAAKQLVSGKVAIDMLAGPSELTVLADASANPEVIAADLLAQAEHDPDAVPILVSLAPSLVPAVCQQLQQQLQDLPTADIARAALDNGCAVVVKNLEEGLALCDRLAPEHLQLHLTHAAAVAPRCRHYGGLFVGEEAAEVLGDYGAGPNHTLPTGATARYTGGLSVFHFLRVRTWLQLDDPQAAQPLVHDAQQLALVEGLHAHARSAQKRSTHPPPARQKSDQDS